MQENRWTSWGLRIYFLIFLVFLFAPMIVMAILSFQGPNGQLTFPMHGGGVYWFRALFDSSLSGSQAEAIKSSAKLSLYIALVVGAIVSILSLTLSMAFRQRFRGDGVLFYLILLALMTPGFLLSVGASLFWQTLKITPEVWTPPAVLGTNVIWGLPFGFLIMVAVWNRYDRRIEEASRDLGASSSRTFREVTLPLIWTGLFGAFLFGFTLSWNEYDRTALLLGSGQLTLPIQIFALTTGSVIHPDLYALGTGTTGLTFLVVGLILLVATLRLKRRQRAVPIEAQVAEELGEVAPIEVESAELESGAGGARAPT
jgi:putative spermidine/putrescine transport system permease protein